MVKRLLSFVCAAVLLCNYQLVMYAQQTAPERIPNIMIEDRTENPVIQIYAGDDYTLAVREDGTVLYAGASELMREAVLSWENIESVDGEFARKKDGTYTSIYGPTNLPVTEEPISITMGSAGNWVALLPDGTMLFSTDPDAIDQFIGEDLVGYGIPEYRYKEVVFGSDSYFALTWSGIVLPFPAYSVYADEILSWSNVKDICFCGGYVPTALTNDGRVLSTSYSKDVDTDGWKDVKKLASNYYLTVGLRADGTVLATGGEYGTVSFLNTISAWTGIRDIVVSKADREPAFAVGLKNDGTVVFAGDISYSQYATVQKEIAQWKNIIQIDAGIKHIVGLTEGGTVVTAGDNSSGQCNIENINDAPFSILPDIESVLPSAQTGKMMWLCNEERFIKLNGSIAGHVDHSYEYNGPSIVKETVGNPNGSMVYQVLTFDPAGLVTSVSAYEGNTVVMDQKNNSYGNPIEISFYGCQSSGIFFHFRNEEILCEFFQANDSSTCQINVIAAGIMISLKPSQKAIISYSDKGKMESITYYELPGKELLSTYIVYDASETAYRINLDADKTISFSRDSNGLTRTGVIYAEGGEEYVYLFHYDNKNRFDRVEYIEDGKLQTKEQYNYSVRNGYAVEYYITDRTGDTSLFHSDTYVFTDQGRIASRTLTFYSNNTSALVDATSLLYDETGNVTHYIHDLSGIREEREFSYFLYECP